MEFEYNGNLEEKDRIELVAKEINNYYPEISLIKARLIASFESPVTTSFNNVMLFKRLYNILFILHKDKMIFSKIFPELNKTYNLIMDDINVSESVIDDIMREINNYIKGERRDFPIISEFY